MHNGQRLFVNVIYENVWRILITAYFDLKNTGNH